MKKTIALALTLLAAGAIAAHAADAKELWEKNCKKCHGEDGKGKTVMGKKLGVKDYTSPKVQVDLKDEEMVKTVKEGVKKDGETKMKSFADALSGDEIKSLVAYIRKFKAKE
ncbi:MAG: c-type cytochrome [Limisphaerales bacterium]